MGLRCHVSQIKTRADFSSARVSHTTYLQRSQEVEKVLLLAFKQGVVDAYHDVRFRGGAEKKVPALMRLDRLDEVRGSSVMQEKYPLPQPPERGAAELPRPRLALPHAVRQAYPHVVNEQIGEEIDVLIAQRSDRGIPCVQRGRVTQRAPDLAEQGLAPCDGRGASGRIRRRRRRRQETHEEGELLDRADCLLWRRAGGVGDCVWSRHKLAVRRFIPLGLKQLVRDPHLHVVRLAREQEQ